MKQTLKIFKIIFTKVFFQKLLSLSLIIILIYSLKGFAVIIFLTFIFSYLFFNFGTFLKTKIDLFIPKIIRNKNQQEFIKKIFNLNILILILYFLFIGMIFYSFYKLIPEITKELGDLIIYIPDQFIEYKKILEAILVEFSRTKSELISIDFTEIISKGDPEVMLKIFGKAKILGAFFIQIFVSMVLSYMFIIDRHILSKFLLGIRNSNFGFFYRDIKSIIEKVVNSFGMIFKAQSIIAITNTFLTTIGLIIIGIINGQAFPFLYTFAIIVFICGFIPVLGTFISSFPIIIIGYSAFGNVWVVLEIVTLICIIHAIEAYFLNPKIVSSYTKIPLSITFLILILSEYFLGFLGLVIGVSLFYLSLLLLKDFDNIISNLILRYKLFNKKDSEK